MRGSIIATGLGKRYRRQSADQPRSLQEVMMRGFRRPPPEWFWGLRDVSFEVAPGRTVGVVGRNGAGKSSLLRLLSGVGRPDEGRVEVHGRVGALLDLGAGMTDDLTGRENTLLAGLIAGMTRDEVRDRFDEIVAFAELERFIDQPLRTYSSGMRLRLAFAVAIYVSPDVLLVDEVLAVGDAAFQRKCLARIDEIKAAGCTIFFVSHDESMVSAICDDVLFLRDGRVVDYGPTADVLPQYLEFVSGGGPTGEAPDVRLDNGRTLQTGKNRFGTLEAELAEVRLLGSEGQPVSHVLPGAPLVVEMQVRGVGESTRGAIASVSMARSTGETCFDTNTSLAEHPDLVGGLDGSATLRLRLDRLDLAEGDYFVDVGLHHRAWDQTYDSHVRAYPLRILAVGPASGHGVLNPPLHWEVEAPVAAPVEAAARITGGGRR